MGAFIFGWILADILWPFILTGVIGWIIYELFTNFWGVMETVVGLGLGFLSFAWDVVSSLFMCVWDISYIGPILAIAGTIAVLSFLSIPIMAILTVLFWICATPFILVYALLSNIPKAGIKEKKAENPETASLKQIEALPENPPSDNN